MNRERVKLRDEMSRRCNITKPYYIDGKLLMAESGENLQHIGNEFEWTCLKINVGKSTVMLVRKG